MDFDKLDELLGKEFGNTSTEFDLFDDFDSTCRRYEFMLKLDDKELENYLWNQIFEIDIETFLKKKIEFSDSFPLLRAFMQKRIQAYLDVAKLIPLPIKTQTLTLSYMSDDEAKAIYQAIIKDEEAWNNLYHFNRDNTEEVRKVQTVFIDRYRNTKKPMLYGIYDYTISKLPVGYVSLTETDRNEKGESILNLEFYVIREYRKKGYAEEASRHLLKSLYKGQQVRYQKTDMLDLYTAVPIHPAIVLAYCKENNVPSACLLENIGFIHDGDIFDDKFSQDGTPMRIKKYHYKSIS